MCWSIPQDKADRILKSISKPLTGAPVSLKQTQHLLGCLNDFSQMCRFLQGFKQPVNQFLASFHNSEQVHLQMPAKAKKDLKVWGQQWPTQQAASPYHGDHCHCHPEHWSLSLIQQG